MTTYHGKSRDADLLETELQARPCFNDLSVFLSSSRQASLCVSATAKAGLLRKANSSEQRCLLEVGGPAR
jgi:hypothetical protein